MIFREEKDGFTINFSDEEMEALNKTKTLYLDTQVGKDFANNLMGVAMKLSKHFMKNESMNGTLRKNDGSNN